ncbi:MAG: glycosyl hydrolase [Puniceicoccaceae bacterium]
MLKIFTPLAGLLICAFLPSFLAAAIVPVDSGSYTTTFPGTDIAGRNGYPGGTPQLSGAAVGRPVPTNDWWSALLNNNHASNLFNYPLTMRTLPTGLDIGLIVPGSGPNGSTQPISDISPVIVGVSGLTATRATVDDYSDWTVTIGWDSGEHSLRATTGIGMPFIHFKKSASHTASVTVNVGTVTVDGEILLITNSQGGANFAVYAPAKSTWVASGNTYTSSLDGKNYWSMAILPAGTPATLAAAWQAYAYVEPVDTQVSWSYDEATAVLRTDYTTTVAIHEGEGTTVVQGLLPHQWGHLASDAPALSSQSLSSIRGELKLLAANTFATERTFKGILPTLPARAAQSPGFDPARLNEKITSMENDTLATWTDSYNEGQVMNRLIQTARIAHETGNFTARDKFIATVKERLEDWLTAEPGEVAFIFHYQPTWTALLGYPAGHGQDTNINDHHFHWGYFIHAAAFMEQFEPGWAEQWGGMIDLLVRDAASPNRDDPMFPFLRNFSPFAGHCWANGFASFPFGNDQESSSESMQFNSSLIHWGAITGNKAIRDLGIYLYVTEQTAIEEYWLDINDRTFKDGYGYSLVSRIWGNGYDNQTFWTSDIAAAYGIELYPIHGGSLYLGHDIEYAESLWAEMAANTGVLNQVANDNLWHDIYWQFLAFTDPEAAIALYDGNPDRNLKFGVSDAQTYYWLHAMNGLGQVDAGVIADDPLAVVFNRNGEKTYVAHNYSTTPKTVSFSDGTLLDVPANSLATSEDLPLRGTITTPFAVAPAGNSVPLELSLTGDTSSLTAVEFFDGPTSIGTLTEAPFVLQTGALGVGVHTFRARLYAGEKFTDSGLASVRVGDSFPYTGTPIAIPGSFDAGDYDWFEGGSGQDITYFDSSIGNNGDYRTGESVDTAWDTNEGAVVGWIGDGEWIDYTVQVASSGLYEVSFRYASDNDAGGGPFYFELDGRRASGDITVASTGDWSTFSTRVAGNIELREGRHVLRIHFSRGEFNLGELTFTRTGDLPYDPPVADAGMDFITPPGSTRVDGSGSTAPSGGSLSYAWEQLAGPSVATIVDPDSADTHISGLNISGLYRFRLTVDDGARDDFDDVEIFVGSPINRPPTASILSPANGSVGVAGQPLVVTVAANDPEGEVALVELFNGDVLLGTLNAPPYAFEWYPPVGSHSLTARVTDAENLTASSTPVSFTANPPLPCTRTSASGDFEYVFSDDLNNPTLTFVPLRAGVGSSLILFYYGTGGGPKPGYSITANTPFRLNATEGQTIGFYFTYNVPEGGERNTLGENMAYTIGTCAESVAVDPDVALLDWRTAHFDPADLADSELEATLWGDAADPEGDTVANLIEFSTGSDPVMESSLPLQWQVSPVDGKLRVRFHRRAELPESWLRLQWSADLVTWSSENVQLTVVSLQDGFELVEASIGNLDTNGAPVHVRLVASQGGL